MIRKREPVGFGDFHQNTIATFLKCAAPPREPDFVSGSRSVYWDVGEGVVRASDHWAGRGNCTGQASCIWSFLGETSKDGWSVGYCPYEDFRVRTRMPVLHLVSEADRVDARILERRQGAVGLPEWTQARGCASIPPWAVRVFPGPEMIPEPAKRLFVREPRLSHAVSTDPSRLALILSGADEIGLGFRVV